MKAPKSEQQLLLESAWKRAFEQDEPLEFTFATRAGAIRARMALYNAVRRAKQGKDEDYELMQAAQGLEIGWTGETSFIMRKIQGTDFITGIEKAIGEKMGQAPDPAAEEALRRVLEKQQEEQIRIPDFDRSTEDPFGLWKGKK